MALFPCRELDALVRPPADKLGGCRSSTSHKKYSCVQATFRVKYRLIRLKPLQRRKLERNQQRNAEFR